MTIKAIAYDPSTLVGTLAYNRFTFPPARNMTADFMPVLDDSGRVTKYARARFSIKFFLFAGATDTPLAYHPPTGVGDLTNTSDLSMLTVRTLLSEPGQKLELKYQGFGQNFSVQDGAIFDVDNGPKPRIIKWNPVGGNKIAYVEWECETSYHNCAASPGQYAQFPFSVSFSIDSSGLTVRTISGKLEIPLSRIPTAGNEASISRPFDYKVMRELVCTSFPMLPQFKRSYPTLEMSMDRKTLSFTITDTEVDSDEAFGPGCENEQVELSASGSLYGSGNLLAGGFAGWDVSLSGTIHLMAGYDKGYAWREIARIFNKLYLTNSKNAHRVIINSADQKESTPPTRSVDGFALLTNVSYSDQLFGRSVSFTLRWVLICNIQNLFAATGLFKPIRDTASANVSAWDTWKTSMGGMLGNGGGYQNLGFSQNDDIIVSLCLPLTKGNPTQPSPNTQANSNESLGGAMEAVSEAKSWITYQPCFELEAVQHTVTHRALGDVSPTQEVSNTIKPAQDGLFTTFYSPTTAQVTAHALRDPTYVLHFYGYAVRVNYAIPVPNVTKAYGQDVKKIGTDIIRPRKLGKGTDPITGKTYSLHGLFWYKRYILAGPPQSNIISSDGHPDQYI